MVRNDRKPLQTSSVLANLKAIIWHVASTFGLSGQGFTFSSFMFEFFFSFPRGGVATLRMELTRADVRLALVLNAHLTHRPPDK
jgi:hypothetical protein